MINFLNKLELDKKKIFLIILAGLILIYLDFRFVIGREIQNIKNIQPKITKLKKDLDTLNKDLAKIQELKNKQTENNQKSPKVKKIISDAETLSLLQNISQIANKDGVQITQIKSSKEAQVKQDNPIASDKFTPIFITLDLLTDYHHFGKFVNDLENSQTFIAVQSFKINSQQANYIKQKISLVLKTYVTK